MLCVFFNIYFPELRHGRRVPVLGHTFNHIWFKSVPVWSVMCSFTWCLIVSYWSLTFPALVYSLLVLFAGAPYKIFHQCKSTSAEDVASVGQREFLFETRGCSVPRQDGKKAKLVIFDKDGTLICFQTMWSSWAVKVTERWVQFMMWLILYSGYHDKQNL